MSKRPPATKAPGKAAGPPANGGRVTNAKALRQAFIAVQQSPDGLDPEPLTVPRCVECPHCQWPVWPREAKVATSRTYARAGIERKPKQEKKEKKEKKPKKEHVEGEEGAEGEEDEEDEDESGSEDSRNSMEQMADELDELRDKADELDARNKELEAENLDLSTRLKQAEDELAEATDKIEFMEEAEVKWREKLTLEKRVTEKLTLNLERSYMIANDRERALVNALEVGRALKVELANVRRRRTLMLERLGEKLMAKEREDYKAIHLRLWRPVALTDRFTRELEELEQRRQREVAELQRLLEIEYAKVQDLEEKKETLEVKLMAAGCKPLMRALAAYNGKAMLQYTFKGWVSVHPQIQFENELEFRTGELAETSEKLENETRKTVCLTSERDLLQLRVPVLEKQVQDLEEELDYIKEKTGANLESIEERLRQEQAKEAEWVRKLKAEEDKLVAAQEEWNTEKDDLELQIKVLEGRLVVAEMDGGGGGGGAAEVDEATRIVPKGQGVLCVGCLKQLLHRAVRPLPCSDALGELNLAKMEEAKRKFFQEELKGAPSADDPLHTQAWKAQKDPYGISRLTVMPQSALFNAKRPAAKVTMDASPTGKKLGTGPGDFGTTSSPNLGMTATPTTGLPALKKSMRMRAGADAAASPLMMSMKEFRPRNFR